MSELVNPRDYMITRKRKKYKFALFHNSPLCHEADAWRTLHTEGVVILQGQTLQRWRDADVLEVGAGNGKFAVELATRYPELMHVALDVKGDRLQQGARLAEERGLQNIRFLRARADQIDELFAPHSLSSIWVTFPDPFPKKRSAARRLTHPNFLKKYSHILKGATLNREDKLSDRENALSGGLFLKHDNRDFFCWSLEQLVAEKWRILELSFDLHDSELHDDYRIQTTYEQKWLAEGLKTSFVRATYED